MSYIHSRSDIHSRSHIPRYSHIANSKVFKSTPTPIHIPFKSHSSLINRNTTRKNNKSGIRYIQELEHKEYQPAYHDSKICGSSLHGLATIIQRVLTREGREQAVAQLDRCINARLKDMKEKHNGGDAAHLFIIDRLKIFKNQVNAYDTNVKIRTIKYDDETYTFNIIPEIPHMLYIPDKLGGKYKKTHRKNRKNKRTRKIKKRKRVGNK